MLEEVHSRPPLLSFSSCIRMRYFESFSAYVEKVKRVSMWRYCKDLEEDMASTIHFGTKCAEMQA